MLGRVTPRRELAYQIAEQFRVLGKPLGLRDCIVVGGMGETAVDRGAGVKISSLSNASHSFILLPTLTVWLCWSADMVSQALELSDQPHVVVATPGRLADHIRSSSTFSLSKIQFLVRTTGWPHTVSLKITAWLKL